MSLIWVLPPPSDGSIMLAQSVNGHVTLATLRRVDGGWEFTFERGARNPGPHGPGSLKWAKRQITGYLRPRIDRLLRPDERCTYALNSGRPLPVSETDALGNAWSSPRVPKRPNRRRYR